MRIFEPSLPMTTGMTVGIKIFSLLARAIQTTFSLKRELWNCTQTEKRSKYERFGGLFYLKVWKAGHRMDLTVVEHQLDNDIA